ncbi:MAG: hypothetical protein FD138_163 [Planctomycetota bacterium]|nr:MAG: hypothetical protein FD138_163 [Planctomycetota bacterium]
MRKELTFALARVVSERSWPNGLSAGKCRTTSHEGITIKRAVDFSIAPTRIPANFTSRCEWDLANSPAKCRAILWQNLAVERASDGFEVRHQARMFVLLDAATESQLTLLGKASPGSRLQSRHSEWTKPAGRTLLLVLAIHFLQLEVGCSRHALGQVGCWNVTHFEQQLVVRWLTPDWRQCEERDAMPIRIERMPHRIDDLRF